MPVELYMKAGFSGIGCRRLPAEKLSLDRAGI
jgi:hypothetical protein